MSGQVTHDGVVRMYLVEELAAEHSRSTLQQAEQMRSSRRLLTLRRARRMEHKAERRLIAAWRRTAELRETLESVDY